jgi:hypothetical protein
MKTWDKVVAFAMGEEPPTAGKVNISGDRIAPLGLSELAKCEPKDFGLLRKDELELVEKDLARRWLKTKSVRERLAAAKDELFERTVQSETPTEWREKRAEALSRAGVPLDSKAPLYMLDFPGADSAIACGSLREVADTLVYNRLLDGLTPRRDVQFWRETEEMPGGAMRPRRDPFTAEDQGMLRVEVALLGMELKGGPVYSLWRTGGEVQHFASLRNVAWVLERERIRAVAGTDPVLTAAQRGVLISKQAMRDGDAPAALSESERKELWLSMVEERAQRWMGLSGREQEEMGGGELVLHPAKSEWVREALQELCSTAVEQGAQFELKVGNEWVRCSSLSEVAQRYLANSALQVPTGISEKSGVGIRRVLGLHSLTKALTVEDLVAFGREVEALRAATERNLGRPAIGWEPSRGRGAGGFDL